ncbi:hypothetical protein QFZ82_005625 [Streptomyces sp. V4I23]|nr:hypothetical protein [Streptomyces sp. V4I23]
MSDGRIFREAWIAGVTKHYSGEPKPSYVTMAEGPATWCRGPLAVHPRPGQSAADTVFVPSAAGTAAFRDRMARSRAVHQMPITEMAISRAAAGQ